MGGNTETELKKLLETAEELLSNETGCHSKMDQKALADMACKAREALEGRPASFSRNREFMNPGREETLAFARDRFTMAPTFFEKGKVYSHYGLKEAITWYQSRNMSLWSEDQLAARRDELLERGKELLEGAAFGDNIGQYDARKGEILQSCLERLETLKKQEAPGATGQEDLPEGLACCVDAMWDFRLSGKLCSDIEAKSLYLLPGEKIEEIKGKLKREGLVRKQYQEIRKAADALSLEDCRMAYEQIREKHSYEALEKRFTIWGDTGRTSNFVTPAGTVGARFSLCLPEDENEAQGMGHIWVTDFHLYSADGPEAFIPNNCFREKVKADQDAFATKGWRNCSQGDSRCVQAEIKGLGSCLYLCNPSPADRAETVCDSLIPLRENSGYTFFFRARQDGKLKEGLRATLEFLDDQGRSLGRFVYRYNRKSMPREGHSAFAMQCDALVYALEGKQEYAFKAKYEMLTFLNDFCQGAEYWLTYNERPEGYDSYGAVQAGRIMCTVASAYSLIRRGDVFTEQERESLYGMADYLIHYCLDMRDRMTLSKEQAQRGSSNWQTDMCIGVVSLMTVLPDYPDRKIWMYNGEAVLRAQLEVNLNEDGSWPESIRYHHAALEHFATFAALWKQETGEDWLLTTRLREMFLYTIHTVTPPYAYFNGRIGTPPFGDHRLNGGDELGIYGLYVERVAETDPGEYQSLPENRLKLASTMDYPDSGIYVFRQGYECRMPGETPCPVSGENYLAVMAARKPIGHGHLDQGSFILYYQNVPVVMDSGIEGYFDASTQWHLSSYSHACLQFAATKEEQSRYRVEEGAINLSAGNYSMDRGWWDVPRNCKVLNVETTEEGKEVIKQNALKHKLLVKEIR